MRELLVPQAWQNVGEVTLDRHTEPAAGLDQRDNRGHLGPGLDATYMQPVFASYRHGAHLLVREHPWFKGSHEESALVKALWRSGLQPESPPLRAADFFGPGTPMVDAGQCLGRVADWSGDIARGPVVSNIRNAMSIGWS